ncbi:MAG TPA: M55 family metallopeptidase [Candidatus Koribacter sp.]|jgi:D-amino peptidase
MKQVFALVVAFVCSTSFAQSKPLKIFISADMEGVAGVSTWDVQANAKAREYEEFRNLMTQEVNAAVEGAYDAGATEVVVADSHGDAQNIDIALLDKRAELIRAWPRPLGMMEGIDNSFAAVVFIGYHAAEGTPGAVLAHTFTGSMAVKLNGTDEPEAGFNAAIAGDFGVPVVFVSGDQVIGEQSRNLFGNIETVAVKQAIGYHAAKMMAPQKAQALIRAGVTKAIQRRAELKPYRVSQPVKMEVRFHDAIEAEVVSYFPQTQRTDGNTIVFTAKDMTEASRFLEAIDNIAIRP